MSLVETSDPLHTDVSRQDVYVTQPKALVDIYSYHYNNGVNRMVRRLEGWRVLGSTLEM
jgi:hypothetical protein